ncbi:MAG: energy-coupling factor ABC transporter ATP-binding protein [Deltaproteobacteria bacterium]|nr:energy-coupling factor ABC transporter ATP-binding protein [Candidatus Zymogenaceae bacterium]
MNGSPAVKTRSLGFRYRRAEKEALSDINLEVETGQLVGVVGRSGAGKSTLMAAVGSFIPHLIRGGMEGSVEIFGSRTDVRPPGEFAGILGMVFQDFETQIFSSRVDIEAAFGPENLGLSRQEIVRRVKDSLAFTGLESKANRVPATLSGGEKQRLAVASVLSMEPRLFIFDEPTTDLDPQGADEMLELVRRLGDERGSTAIMATHDTDRLVGADRVVVLENGRVAAVGSPGDILTDQSLIDAHRLRPLPHLACLAPLLSGPVPLVEAEAIDLARERGLCFVPERISDIEQKDTEKASRTGPPIIEFSDVSFGYQGAPQRLFEKLSCDIHPGECVAVIGSNGGGKTTLACHMNGLIVPDSGEVRVDGTSLTRRTPRELSELVGFVHQNPDRMIFSETVYDEAAFGLKIRGMEEKEIRRRVEEVLDVVGLGDRIEEDPFMLTKGERQRLAVASILSVGPRILILDEPTTGLDYGEINDMMEVVTALNRSGHTIVIITHNMDVVARYAKRVLLFSEGRIMADGTPRDVFCQDELLCRAGIVPPREIELGRVFGFPTLTAEEFLFLTGASGEAANV